MFKANNIAYKIGRKAILKPIELNFSEGELIAIIGPNGAGKSTLLSILANESEQKNDIHFKDKSYKKWEILELSMHKAKFSQNYNHNIPLLVKEVVLMGRYPYFTNQPHKTDLEIVDESMEMTGVLQKAEQNYLSLSGGEKQRVHLARFLAQLQNKHSNKILFLDEPLNNLDVKFQYKIMEIIRKFSEKGNIAVVVLHDLNIAYHYSDKVLLLKDGSRVQYGHPKEVLTEEILSETYEFPCKLFQHEEREDPIILFGQ